MMRLDDELWMRKLREVLKDYSEPPVPNGWGRLEDELTPSVARRIRPYAWWAAAVVILALSGVSLFFIQSPTAEDIRQTMPPALAVTPDVLPKTKEPEQLISQTMPKEKSIVTTKYKVRNLSVRNIRMTITTTSAPEEVTIIDTQDDKDANANEVPSERTETKKEITEDKVKNDVAQHSRPSSRDKWHVPVTSEKKHASEGKWSVAASFSNGSGASSEQTQDFYNQVQFSSGNNLTSMDMIPIGEKDNLVFNEGMPYLRETATISEMKHKQPISVGLSVRKNLSNGFSIESGVTYTMLSSEAKSMNNSHQQIEQKLHYIGIPLRGNWNFVDTKRFTVYISAGGMVEKNVYGKIGSEKETVKPIQFSLAGGVGGQLNVTNRIGLYVEPGVSYFFDDGSDVETIRKEIPLNINLQGGIRFTY